MNLKKILILILVSVLAGYVLYNGKTEALMTYAKSKYTVIKSGMIKRKVNKKIKNTEQGTGVKLSELELRCKGFWVESRKLDLDCREKGGNDESCNKLMNNKDAELKTKFKLTTSDLNSGCSKIFEKLYQIDLICSKRVFRDNTKSIEDNMIESSKCAITNTESSIINSGVLLDRFRKANPGGCATISDCPRDMLCSQFTRTCEKFNRKVSDYKEIEIIVKGEELSEQGCTHSGICSMKNTSGKEYHYREDEVNIDLLLQKYNKEIPDRRVE